VIARLVLALVLVVAVASAADARPWSWLGVRIRDLSETEMDDLATRHGIREGFGVVIVEVMADTPAAQGGMRSGDIVVAFNGRPITETRLLQRLISQAPLDRDVRLTVLRPAGRVPLSFRLVSMPRLVAGERTAAGFGFVLQEGAGQSELGGPRPSTGTPAVTFVARGSSAEKGGLVVGDMILQVNDRAVLTRDAVREALSDVAPDEPLQLTVRRGEGHVNLTLPAPDERPRP
jgi:serine protease Do